MLLFTVHFLKRVKNKNNIVSLEKQFDKIPFKLHKNKCLNNFRSFAKCLVAQHGVHVATVLALETELTIFNFLNSDPIRITESLKACIAFVLSECKEDSVSSRYTVVTSAGHCFLLVVKLRYCQQES